MSSPYFYPWIASVTGTVDAIKMHFHYLDADKSPAIQQLIQLEQELGAHIPDLATTQIHSDHMKSLDILLERLGWTSDRIERYDNAIVALAYELAGELNITHHLDAARGHYQTAALSGKYHCFEHACSMFVRFLAIDAKTNPVTNNIPHAIAAIWHDAGHYTTPNLPDSVNTAAAVTLAYAYLSSTGDQARAPDPRDVLTAIHNLQFPYNKDSIDKSTESLRTADLTQTNDQLLPYIGILWQVRLYRELRSSWDKGVQFREFVGNSLKFINQMVHRDSFCNMKFTGEMVDAWRLSWLVMN